MLMSFVSFMVCVCVSTPVSKELAQTNSPLVEEHVCSSRWAVDHYHSLPNEDSDRSVVKQCGTPHCVPAFSLLF